jgi:hypothetical protein
MQITRAPPRTIPGSNIAARQSDTDSLAGNALVVADTAEAPGAELNVPHDAAHAVGAAANNSTRITLQL